MNRFELKQAFWAKDHIQSSLRRRARRSEESTRVLWAPREAREAGRAFEGETLSGKRRKNRSGFYDIDTFNKSPNESFAPQDESFSLGGKGRSGDAGSKTHVP